MMLKRKFLFIIVLVFSSVLTFAQDEESGFKIGGALRYNIFDKSWVDSQTEPQFTWDTWRLNVDGSLAGVDLSFEYRFYPTSNNSHFIHHGYLGYGFGESEDLYMKLGVSQVPFGITKYASHSWWFQIPYYVGLEDDYDMGIKFDYTGVDNLKLTFGYFRQMEPRGVPDQTARYSYDIMTVESTDEVYAAKASIQELNQFNLRAALNVSESIELGLSGQVGGIYNTETEESETSTAFAGHIVGNFGNFNLKAEYINYNYAAKDNNGDDMDVISMGAYGFPYNVAAKGNIYVAGLAYTIPVDLGPISSIQPYFDWSMIDKSKEDFETTVHMVPGFLISAGGIYTYVDYAIGKNNAWLGSWTNGLAAGTPDAEYENRFNINIGYYF